MKHRRIFLIQLKKELRELWATRKLLIIVIVMTVFGMLSPLTAKLLPDLLESVGENQGNVQITIGEITERDAVDQFVSNMSQMVMLLVILLSFGVVVNERDKGLMTLMFPHPIPRSVFILAKFTALLLAFGLGLLLSAGAMYFYTAVLFDALPFGAFSAMVALIGLYLLSLVALSILASTVGRSMTSAAASAFGLVGIVLIGGTFSSLAPTKLIEWGGNLAKDLPTPERWGAAGVTILVIVGTLVASCVVIERQEIE